MIPRGGLALAVVAIFLLSGCAGSPPTASLAELKLQHCDPRALSSPDVGAVEGYVRDDELQVVPGASVQVRELRLVAQAGPDGYYAFCDVAPGRYTLDASRLGYEGGSLTIAVEAGRVTAHSFELKAIPVAGPLHPRREVIGPFQGYVQCRMSMTFVVTASSGPCGFAPLVPSPNPVTELWTQDKVQMPFKLTSEDWHQIVFEARWKPSSIATNPKMVHVFSYQGRPSTHWFADSGGHLSPIKWNYTLGARNPGGQITSGTPEKPDWKNHTLITWITLPFAGVPSAQHPTNQPVWIAYELRFEMMVTVLYSSTAPPEYSAFQD